MIFNNPKKGSPSHRRAVSLPAFSTAKRSDVIPDRNEDFQALKPADAAEGNGRVFRGSDFVFLSDNVNCWVVRASEISMLEAWGNYTRVSLGDATALIRRPLRECECRLDPSTFFRTRRDCIVNLNRVKEIRVLDAKRFLLILLDGKEVPMSRKQSLLFRRTKAL
jgi:DNA-binding LytR/AlgR family response regulator